MEGLLEVSALFGGLSARRRFYDKMKGSEKTVRNNDLLFCGAPHLFIAHERCAGKWAEDSKVNCNIATTYFELLCNAFGLGTLSALVIPKSPTREGFRRTERGKYSATAGKAVWRDLATKGRKSNGMGAADGRLHGTGRSYREVCVGV